METTTNIIADLRRSLKIHAAKIEGMYEKPVMEPTKYRNAIILYRYRNICISTDVSVYIKQIFKIATQYLWIKFC